MGGGILGAREEGFGRLSMWLLKGFGGRICCYGGLR